MIRSHRNCSVEGCDVKVSARGLCNKHYQRMINGVPMAGNAKRTLHQRLREKIEVDLKSGCFIWLGAKSGGPRRSSNHKYGYIRVDGKSLRAHRVMYEMENGPIPEGIILRHTCDNPLCVNPAHLIPGTQFHNMQDMISRNRDRHPVGEANHSKLTEASVLSIRCESAKGTSHHELAEQYGVHVVTIRNIVNGKKWAYLNE